MTWLALLKPFIRPLAAILGIALALWLAYSWAYTRGGDAKQREWDAAKAEAQAQHAKELAAARSAERMAAQRANAIAAQYEEDKRHAQATADAVIADLRSGHLRLRQHWQGCSATSRLSGAAVTAAQSDAEARLREADAAEAVSDAQRADAWIQRLQEYARLVSGQKAP